MSAVVGSLRVNLSANTAAFKDGLNKASGSLKGFMGKVSRIAGPVAAMGGALAAAGLKAADTAVEIRNLARISGASMEEFQRAAGAAKSVGIEQEKLADIFKDTNDKIGDFIATGGGELKDFFENVAPKVGVTAEQFKNLSGPQALQLYVDTLEKAGVSQKEMVFYLESIADEGSALLPLLRDQGAEMDRLGDKTAKYGLVGAESAEAAAKLKEALNVLMGALKKVGVALIDAGVVDFLTTMLGMAAEAISVLPDLAKRIIQFGKDVVATVTGIWQAFVEMKDRSIQAVKDMVTGIKDWMLGGLKSAADGARAFKDSVLGWFSETEDEAVGNSIIPDMVMAIEGWFDRLGRTAPRAAKQMGQQILDGFTGVADAMMDKSREVGDALKSLGMQLAEVLAQGALLGKGPLGKAFGGGLQGLITDAVGGMFSRSMATPAQVAAMPLPSFESGGFTGGGPRAGGLDGRGGFLAMMHPRETVVDHERGGGQTVNITNNVNAAGMTPEQAGAMLAASNRRSLQRVSEQRKRGNP